MDPGDLERKISERTKAVIPVHYGGHPCDMDEILALARDRGLYVVEDAANCTGAEYRGRKIGSLDSDFTCFSFEAKKNMSTGDGGMLTTNRHDDLVDRIHKIKWVGMDKDTLARFSKDRESEPWEYDIVDLGYKYNMNDITAAMGLVQLRKLDGMNESRRRLAARYSDVLSGEAWLRTPGDREYVLNGNWLYILRVEDGDRGDLMRHLLANDVLSNTSFKPLHLFTFYREYYLARGIEVKCPIAEREWAKIVVLPLYPDMTDSEQDQVIAAIQSFR
jgi:perosamine synthetase